MAMKILAINTKVIVKPDMIRPFFEAAKINALATSKEPGCLQFVMGEEDKNEVGNVFYFHDQFVNKQAYADHSNMPHFKSFLTKVNPMVSTVENSMYLCNHEPKERESSPNTFCLNVESVVKPELFDEYEQLMLSHAANSQKETGCLQFDWGVAEDGSFYMHEEYEDRAAFEAHASSPHFARFVKFNKEKDPYIKPQEVAFFETIPF